MVRTRMKYSNQHACCVLGVLAFLHPLILSIPLTLYNGGIDGGKMFQLFVAEL